MLITVIFACLLPCSTPYAADKEIPEYEIKAAFIYNFAKFIEWPNLSSSDTNNPLVLCFMDGETVRDAFKTVKEATVKGRKVMIQEYQGLNDMSACHILFVPSSWKEEQPKILETVRNKPILTIGETQEFCEQGGIINFRLIENKVRFEINIDAAKQAGLMISSQLLKLARIVKKDN
jgi:hypothetical protein